MPSNLSVSKLASKDSIFLSKTKIYLQSPFSSLFCDPVSNIPVILIYKNYRLIDTLLSIDAVYPSCLSYFRCCLSNLFRIPKTDN